MSHIQRLFPGFLAVVLAFATACGGGDSPSGGASQAQQTLIVGTVATAIESDHFNMPLRRPPAYNFMLSSFIFRGLVSLDVADSYKPKPELAKSVDISADGLTYTATLRDGLTWHDGKPVTAEDVKFTVDLIRDPKNRSQAAGEFTYLDTVAVVNPQTVRFTLKQPYAPFMVALTFDLAPKHILETQDVYKGEFALSKPVGTGPYKVIEARKGEFISLESFSGYHGKKPKIQKVVLRFFADRAGLLAALKTGELHVADVTTDEMTALGDSKYQFPSVKGAAPYSIAFNMSAPLFADANVRLAMNHAIDRDALIKAALGKGTPASGPLPGSSYEATGLEAYKLDPARVQSLMQTAGWAKGGDGVWAKGGQRFAFTIHAPGFFNNGAQFIADDLKRAGFDVKVDTTRDYTWIYSNLNDVQAVTYSFGAPSDPDSIYLALHSSRSVRNGGYVLFYNNPAVDAALDRGRSGRDTATRQAAYREVQELVRKDPPFLFAATTQLHVAVDKTLKGFTPNIVVGSTALGPFTWNVEEWSLSSK